MFQSKFSKTYLDRSAYHITDRELQTVIQQYDITRIASESVVPHLQITEVRRSHCLLLETLSAFYLVHRVKIYENLIQSFCSTRVSADWRIIG